MSIDGKEIERLPVVGPLAKRSLPLLNASLTRDADDVVDFSTVDFSYYGALFSLTIDATPFTDRHEFPAITPYHMIVILSSGNTHTFAVGRPLSILDNCAFFQIFAPEDTNEGRFVIPGVLRAPVHNTYLPEAYPSLPSPSSSSRDAIDPLWNLIGPLQRWHGWIQFPKGPAGKRLGVETHVFVPVFDDELIRARCRVAEHDGGAVEGGSSVMNVQLEGGRLVQRDRCV